MDETTKDATWVGGPQDGEVVTLPPGTEFVEMVFLPDRLPEFMVDMLLYGQSFIEHTKMRYPVVPGGPTGYRILYYRGVKSEE